MARECGPDDLVVVLIPDSGRLYLSSVFNDAWLDEYGFTTHPGITVGDVLDAKPGVIPPLVYARPTETVRDAIRLLQQHGLSQMPVAKNEMPLAAAEVMGSIDELRLMERVFADADVLGEPVEDVMSPALATIGSGQPVELAVELLDHASALLVLDGGRPRTVLARTDVLRFLSPDDVKELA